MPFMEIHQFLVFCLISSLSICIYVYNFFWVSHISGINPLPLCTQAFPKTALNLLIKAFWGESHKTQPSFSSIAPFPLIQADSGRQSWGSFQHKPHPDISHRSLCPGSFLLWWLWVSFSLHLSHESSNQTKMGPGSLGEREICPSNNCLQGGIGTGSSQVFSEKLEKQLVMLKYPDV